MHVRSWTRKWLKSTSARREREWPSVREEMMTETVTAKKAAEALAKKEMAR